MANIPFLNNAYFSAKVGIGTDNPLGELHVKNVSELYTDLDGSDAAVNFLDNESDVWRIGIRASDNSFRFSQDATSLGSNVRLTIADGGNVGIGTPSPSYKLQVKGSVALDVMPGHQTEGTIRIGRYDNNTSRYNDIKSYVSSTAASNYLKFSVHGGVENATVDVMTLKGSGNVGIGTTSPGAKLEISGNSQSSTPALRINCSDSSVQLDQVAGSVEFSVTDASSPGAGVKSSINSIALNSIGSRYGLGFNTTSGVNNVERMRIDQDGNVGIGTTSPDAKLEIIDTSNPGATSGSVIIEGRRDGSPNVLTLRAKDASAPADALPNGQGPVLRFQGFDGTDFENMGYIQVAANGQAVADGDAPSFMAFGTSADSSSSPSERMRIDSAGNVGIGITAITASVNADDLQIGNGTGGNRGLTVTAQSNSGAAIYFGDADNTNMGSVRYDNSNDSMKFFTNTSEQIRIDSSGNVGIGNTSPSEKLDVAGNIKIQSALLSNQGNTDVSGLELVANVLIASYTAAFFDFVVKKGTNVRSGTVYACHDGTNVEFTETSTNDLGNTSDVVLSVDISGTNMRLLADAATSGWSVKSLIRAI